MWFYVAWIGPAAFIAAMMTTDDDPFDFREIIDDYPNVPRPIKFATMWGCILFSVLMWPVILIKVILGMLK